VADSQLQPHKITKPIQLLVVWMIGLVSLVGTFLASARLLDSPSWIRPFLTISAVALVPIFMGLLFLLQTKFRKELQDDPYYSKWLETQRQDFKDFKPENLSGGSPGLTLTGGGTEDLESSRIKRYEHYKGVFLVHSWRPSRIKGQVADVLLKLQQHGEGPLSKGLVERVEYALGPKFFSGSVEKRNQEESFRLEISAYGPMLCLARVHLTDQSTFVLERYVDFAPTTADVDLALTSGRWSADRS
jgi:hypothetical protein